MLREPLLASSEGARLDGVLDLPGRGRWPCVIAAHGLFSTKASEKYLSLAAHLTEAGFACARFDFRGCGQSGGTIAETTVAGRIADLKAVLTRLQEHEATNGQFFLVGSSLGGYVALFVAEESPQVIATAVWATPAHLRDLTAREEALAAHGLGLPFFRELARGTYAEAPAGVARCLIIHGERDELVPPAHACVLYTRAKEPKALEIVPGADHRLSNPEDRARAIRLTGAWYKRHL
ncbi:MAG TPA: alpha/beta fold hydrolase [Candidatus Methylomirabilis sp.]|nr:alpha/beta fold hydrolase [Candidatus Methylomirabilis sp.]